MNFNSTNPIFIGIDPKSQIEILEKIYTSKKVKPKSLQTYSVDEARAKSILSAFEYLKTPYNDELHWEFVNETFKGEEGPYSYSAEFFRKIAFQVSLKLMNNTSDLIRIRPKEIQVACAKHFPELYIVIYDSKLRPSNAPISGEVPLHPTFNQVFSGINISSSKQEPLIRALFNSHRFSLDRNKLKSIKKEFGLEGSKIVQIRTNLFGLQTKYEDPLHKSALIKTVSDFNNWSSKNVGRVSQYMVYQLALNILNETKSLAIINPSELKTILSEKLKEKSIAGLKQGRLFLLKKALDIKWRAPKRSEERDDLMTDFQTLKPIAIQMEEKPNDSPIVPTPSFLAPVLPDSQSAIDAQSTEPFNYVFKDINLSPSDQTKVIGSLFKIHRYTINKAVVNELTRDFKLDENQIYKIRDGLFDLCSKYNEVLHGESLRETFEAFNRWKSSSSKTVAQYFLYQFALTILNKTGALVVMKPVELKILLLKKLKCETTRVLLAPQRLKLLEDALKREWNAPQKSRKSQSEILASNFPLPISHIQASRQRYDSAGTCIRSSKSSQFESSIAPCIKLSRSSQPSEFAPADNLRTEDTTEHKIDSYKCWTGKRSYEEYSQYLKEN